MSEDSSVFLDFSASLWQRDDEPSTPTTVYPSGSSPVTKAEADLIAAQKRIDDLTAQLAANTEVTNTVQQGATETKSQVGEVVIVLDEVALVADQAIADAQAAHDFAQQEADAAMAEAVQAKADALAAYNLAVSGAADADAALIAAAGALTAANNAQTSANGAQAVADDAAADLLLLAGKTGRVIRSSAEPTLAEDKNSNNLWLDLDNGQLHQWNGSAWAVITDTRLTAAAAAADTAANLAADAQLAADNAAALASAVNGAVVDLEARAIVSTVIEYSVHSSETVAPTTGWSTATPTRTPGTFIWMRTLITYGDNSTDLTNPVLLTGNAGAQGTQGIQGIPGSSLYTWVKYADSPTTGMSDSPTNKLYIGIAVNKSSPTESSTYGDYTWSLIKGDQGVQGPTGNNGAPTYTWIKYGTSATGAGITDDPTGMTYIGLAHNKPTATESLTPGDYTWSLIQGPQGIQGPATYTWLKYADSPTTGMSDSPTGKAYIGLAYNKSSATESTNYADYSWSLIQGPQGIPGTTGSDGVTTYTWVKYGTSAAGAGLSDSPTGATYIGLAFNKTTAVESTTPGDYTWSLIQGPQGNPGTPAALINLTATAQVLTSPAGGGATTPTTATVTGAAVNTTITVWEYSVNGAAFSATVPTGASRTGNVVTITGGTMTAATIAVRMADVNGIADTLTVAKVSNGATGATGSTGGTGPAGADGYTTLLTNESHIFPGDVSNALAGSTTSTVVAYKGGAQIAATVGTITGQVTGLTTSIASNGTTAPVITVTVTTALTTANGVLTIPLTVDGKSFTKFLSWSVGFKGATGSTGSTGATGVGISTVTTYFLRQPIAEAVPALPTANPPANDPVGGQAWTTTEPTYVTDTALYSTTRVVYTNSTFSYTPVSRMSAFETAGAAQTIALAAQADADAASAAASAAQGVATSAQADADQALLDAAAASGIATSKADVLIQSTTPVAGMQKATTLWIDTTTSANTPKRWDGSAWVAVTDKVATDAAAAAVAAQGTANTAITNAATAKDTADAAAAAALLAQNKADTADAKATTANGRITIAASTPVAGDGVGKPVGALWYVKAGAVYTSIWEWSGSAWATTTVGTGGINDSAITDAKIAANAVTSSKLVDDAVTAAKLATNSVTDDAIADAAVATASLQDSAVSTIKIANLAVGSAKIADAAIVEAKIGNLAVTNAKIADLAVNSAKVADAAIVTAKIGDLQVTTGKIALLAVGSAQIGDAAIVTAKIGDAQITNAKIANLAVDAAKIADATITGAKIANATIGTAQIADLAVTNAKIGDLSVAKLTATAATFPTAVVTTLVGQSAFLENLAAQRIVVGDSTNLWRDKDFNGAYTPWTKNGSTIRKAGTGTQHGAYYDFTKIETVPGEKFVVTYTDTRSGSTTTGFTRVHVQRQPASGVWAYMNVAAATGDGGGTTTGAVFTIPADTSAIRFGFHTESTMPSTTTSTISNIIVRKLVPNILIEDGAITANKLSADALHVSGAVTIGGTNQISNALLAPEVTEGISNSIDTATSVIRTDVSNEISETANNLSSTWEATFATQDALNTQRTSIDAAISTATSDVQAQLTQTQTALDSRIDGLDQKQTELNNYVIIDSNGLLLGDTASPFKVRITNSKLAFLDAGQEVAYVSNKALNITDAIIRNKFSLGKGGAAGFFDWEPRTNGNLSFRFRSAT